MLPKSKRLSKSDFDSYFKVGKRIHSPNLQLIYTNQTAFSGAVVVGKKVFKQAVKRNKLRRSLYGVLYREYQQGKLSGVNMVIVKPSARQLSKQNLLAEIKELLAKKKF